MSNAAHARRRRRLERAVESSDVRRFRAFLPAALAGVLAVVAALVLGEGPRQVLAPGALALPHAALSCASCHARNAAGDACTSCHGEHRSRRQGHQDLAASGKLTCSTCHAIHHGEEGLAFDTSGRVTFYGSGFERELAPAGFVLPREAASVPLIRARECSGCHDVSGGRDVAAHCFAAGRPAAGADFALCFDEHRPVATNGSAKPAERDAAVEATRALVQSANLRAAAFSATFGSSALYVSFGLAVAFAALGFARRRARAVAHAARRPRVAPNGVRRLPVIDASRCLGCEACVDACPYDALEVRRYVAGLVRPDDCCGAGPCLDACPNGSLTLRSDSGVSKRGPLLSECFESPEQPGLFVAGDASGSSLIRNAVRQGVSVAETVAERCAKSASESGARGPSFDLIVVGAGPAGLAAALTAKARGLRVVVLEQASIAESIRRFSRGKLVLDAATADEALPLFLADAPKEELLGRWLRTVRTSKLEVREGARVVGVEPAGGDRPRGFRVTAELASVCEVLAGRYLLLAVGARGTPRPLPVPVPGRLEGRIHYELSDARTFTQKRVIVVGLGDVAMETALALAAQPGCDVTVLHRGAGFRRGKQRNIDALSTLAARGRVKLWFHAAVEGFERGGALVSSSGERRTLPFDAMFVHIGALPADELLRKAGVAIAREQE